MFHYSSILSTINSNNKKSGILSKATLINWGNHHFSSYSYLFFLETLPSSIEELEVWCENQFNTLNQFLTQEFESIKENNTTQIHSSLLTAEEYSSRFKDLVSSFKTQFKSQCEEIRHQLSTETSLFQKPKLSAELGSTDEDRIITFTFRNEKEYQFPLSFFQHYYKCPLTKCLKNTPQPQWDQPINYDASPHYFDYVYRYLFESTLEIEKLSMNEKYELHEEFLYYTVPLPLCLQPYDYQWYKKELWRSSQIININIDNRLFSINKQIIETNHYDIPFFQQDPSTIQYNNKKHYWYVNIPIYEYIYVIQYINTNTIQLLPDDQNENRLRSIVQAFNRYRMVPRRLWKQLGTYCQFQSSKLIPDDCKKFLSTAVGIEKEWKLLFRYVLKCLDDSIELLWMDSKPLTFMTDVTSKGSALWSFKSLC